MSFVISCVVLGVRFGLRPCSLLRYRFGVLFPDARPVWPHVALRFFTGVAAHTIGPCLCGCICVGQLPFGREGAFRSPACAVFGLNVPVRM